MAVLDPVRDRSSDPEREAGLRLPGLHWWLVGAAVLLLVGLGWKFLADPTLSAPTRDPAWYTWRAELLMNTHPSVIVQDWGPFGMFSGGYRVTVPLSGALLQQVGGIDKVTFTTILMVAMPVLSSLALGAFAYRHKRDPLLFVLTFVASGALYLATPYVGYLDNLMGLYLLALTLPFLSAARTSFGARSAVALFMALATLTHPTTVAIYVLVLGALGGWHLLTHRFSIPKALNEYGPMLTSAAVGVVIGLLFWVGGLWGATAPFADAALPPPYPLEVFRSTLGDWVASFYPVVAGPLMAVAIGWIAYRGFKRDLVTDDHDRMSLLWMLPLLGTLGFLLGLAYPYYRFMNTTLAPILLVGTGAWLVVRWLSARRVVAGVVGLLLVLSAFGWVFLDGVGGQWSATGPKDRWFHPSYRAAMASAEAYAEALPEGTPLVFVNDYRDERVAWGWSKTFANVARAGLDGDLAEHTAIYFGQVDDFLAGQPSGETTTDIDCKRPHDIQDQIYGAVSVCFFEDMEERLAAEDLPPAVFVAAPMNIGSPNAALDHPSETPIGPGIVVLTGDGLAPVSDGAVAAAQRAGQEALDLVADPPGPFENALHLLWVLLVLGVILVVPGLISARWFELGDRAERVALIPGISIGLVLFAGVIVVAVTRAPFSVVHGWLTIGLAVSMAVVFRLLARRREAGRAVVMPAVYRSLSLFENRSFMFLMGTLFLALLGDGIVQGGLAKVIAFGGKEGFDISAERSPQDLLALILLTYVPYTLFSPFVGVLIDRFDRRKLLVAVNLLRAILVAAVGLAGIAIGFDDIGSFPLIVALLLSLACTRVTLAIKSAGLPNVLHGRELMKGNATAQAGSAIFQLVGGAIALVGTAVFDAGPVVLLGAIAYLVGSFFARRVTDLEHQRDTTTWREDLRRMGHDVVDGIREVRRRPGASFGIFSFAWLRLQWSFVALSAALVARDVLGSESKTPLLIAAGTGAAGAVIGFVLAQALRKRVPATRLLVSALMAAAIGTLAFALLGGTAGLGTVAFVTALAYFVGKVSVDTIVQRALPDEFRGRGFALFDIALNAGWIVSAFVLWLGWESLGQETLLLIAGVVFVLTAVGVLLWSRKVAPYLDETDPEQGEPVPTTA